MKQIVLKDKREASVQRFHPWVFSGGVARKPNSLQDGEWVEVCSSRKEVLGKGHYQDGSICVRLLSFGDQAINQDFWNEKILAAFRYRERLGLIGNPKTNCYRLIHAEGDGLPGLIIDVYGDAAIVQCHSIGMHLDQAAIIAALKNVYGDRLRTIYDKSSETLPKQYAEHLENSFLLGDSNTGIALEYGHQFEIDWVRGQKTGFFLDQRENRRLLAEYAAGKQVLNAYAYSGGFSIYALQAGATFVDSVDSSAKANELTEQNMLLNGFNESQQKTHTSDVVRYLQEHPGGYEVMIVDPPAFAKNLEKRHNAVQGYKRLNALAMQKIASGGILFTFSCSQVVNRQLFYDTIVAAAIEAGRQVRVMHHLHQPPDHPVSLFHPEGEYLKGLVVYVE
jgi:23S rRNA (cytosine1962-C5)-methyltransferase